VSHAPFERLHQMMAVLGIDPAAQPVIWDADFLHGPRNATGADIHVLR